MNQNLIGINQMAKKLDVPISWIYSRTRTNDIPHYKVGKYCKFDESEVWDWLEKERFPNVSYDSSGYRYNDLPRILADFDVGLVIYKGNTTNFIYNVPNKMFEYLVCGLDVWFPKEMKGICNFFNRTPAPILKLDFTSLDKMIPLDSSTAISETFDRTSLTAEQAFAPLLGQLGMTPLEHQA